MGIMSFNPYEDKPIEQFGLKRCCVCSFDVAKHVKKLYSGKWLGKFVDNLPLYFCQRCGYELSLGDIDILDAKERGEIL
jgi:hypothetical protein